jgi:hypothetical protein
MQVLAKKEKKALPSGRALWRANQLGLLTFRDQPGEPMSRRVIGDLLTEAAEAGLWKPGQSRP